MGVRAGRVEESDRFKIGVIMNYTNKTSIKVFLCYASDDKSFARGIFKDLTNQSFDVWFDEESLLPGQDWDRAIREAVRLADVVLICLSKKSINKEGYIQKEIRIALDVAEEKPDGTIFIIPIRIEDCLVPTRINRWQWIDFYPSSSRENNYQKLIKSLKLRAEQKEGNLLPVRAIEKPFIPLPFFFTSSKAWISPNYKNVLNKSNNLLIDEDKISNLVYILEEAMSSLNIPARVVRISKGPRFLRFGVEPLFRRNKNFENIKVSINDIVARSSDIALALGAKNINISYAHDNYSYIGIDIPHENPFDVNLLDIVESKEYQVKQKPLSIVLGRDIEGTPVLLNLANSPNLLIGGAMGSGKSACLTGCICSLLINNSPNEIQILFIDTRKIEFSVFSGIPHLLSSAINEAEEIISSLKWLFDQANERKKLFSKHKSRNVNEYNSQVDFEEKLPHIVVFIGELSDLITYPTNEAQTLLTAIAGAARITGIHIIAAIQLLPQETIAEPIKQSFTSRIALRTSSSFDSTNIIGQPGAEKLFGNGDMILLSIGHNTQVHMQGILISEDEVSRVVNFWKSQTV